MNDLFNSLDKILPDSLTDYLDDFPDDRFRILKRILQISKGLIDIESYDVLNTLISKDLLKYLKESMGGLRISNHTYVQHVKLIFDYLLSKNLNYQAFKLAKLISKKKQSTAYYYRLILEIIVEYQDFPKVKTLIQIYKNELPIYKYVIFGEIKDEDPDFLNKILITYNSDFIGECMNYFKTEFLYQNLPIRPENFYYSGLIGLEDITILFKEMYINDDNYIKAYFELLKGLIIGNHLELFKKYYQIFKNLKPENTRSKNIIKEEIARLFCLVISNARFEMMIFMYSGDDNFLQKYPSYYIRNKKLISCAYISQNTEIIDFIKNISPEIDINWLDIFQEVFTYPDQEYAIEKIANLYNTKVSVINFKISYSIFEELFDKLKNVDDKDRIYFNIFKSHILVYEKYIDLIPLFLKNFRQLYLKSVNHIEFEKCNKKCVIRLIESLETFEIPDNYLEEDDIRYLIQKGIKLSRFGNKRAREELAEDVISKKVKME